MCGVSLICDNFVKPVNTAWFILFRLVALSVSSSDKSVCMKYVLHCEHAYGSVPIVP